MPTKTPAQRKTRTPQPASPHQAADNQSATRMPADLFRRSPSRRGPAKRTVKGLSLEQGTVERLIAVTLHEHGPMLRTPLWGRVSEQAPFHYAEFVNALRRMRQHGYVRGCTSYQTWHLTDRCLRALAPTVADEDGDNTAAQPQRMPVGHPDPMAQPAELLTRSQHRPTANHTDRMPLVLRLGALDARALPRVEMGVRVWPDGRRGAA